MTYWDCNACIFATNSHRSVVKHLDNNPEHSVKEMEDGDDE